MDQLAAQHFETLAWRTVPGRALTLYTRMAPVAHKLAVVTLPDVPVDVYAPEDGARQLAVVGTKAAHWIKLAAWWLPEYQLHAAVLPPSTPTWLRVKRASLQAPLACADPVNLARVLAAGLLCKQSSPRNLTTARVELKLRPVHPQIKQALDAHEQQALFEQTIPVDAFNQVVWNDVHAIPNPWGTRSTWGTNEQPLHTPPPVAATVTGIVAGAGALNGRSRVSPWEIATTAATTAGTGYLGGLVLGKTLGALAGLSPETQQQLQRAGLWGGMLTGAVNAVLNR
jgi:hypothetical protein